MFGIPYRLHPWKIHTDPYSRRDLACFLKNSVWKSIQKPEQILFGIPYRLHPWKIHTDPYSRRDLACILKNPVWKSIQKPEQILFGIPYRLHPWKIHTDPYSRRDLACFLKNLVWKSIQKPEQILFGIPYRLHRLNVGQFMFGIACRYIQHQGLFFGNPYRNQQKFCLEFHTDSMIGITLQIHTDFPSGKIFLYANTIRNQQGHTDTYRNSVWICMAFNEGKSKIRWSKMAV